MTEMIEKYLYILLHTHDEVIVPDLGAFLATYSSSQVQSSQIKPPHKKIVFYPQLDFDKNDLLKNTLMSEEDLSESEFESLLEHFLSEIEQNMVFESKSALKELGTLTRKPNGELQFEQSQDSNLLSDSFGLPNLNFTPIATSSEKQETVTPLNTAKTTSQDKSNSDNHTKEKNTMDANYYKNPEQEEEKEDKKSLLIWLLMIPLLFFFVLLLYFVFQKDKFEDFKSYITGKNTELVDDTQDTPVIIEELVTTDTNDDEVEVVEEEADTSEVVVEEEHDIPIKVEEREAITVSGDGILTQKTGRYYIIVGGFGDTDKARRFRQALASHGYKVSFIPHNKRSDYYRVALTDFANEREAYNKRSQLRANYPNAWVIKY